VVSLGDLSGGADDGALAMPVLRHPDINLSALIDIAFILVIFIVLAANFDRYNQISVDLPAVKSNSSGEDTRGRLSLSISASGHVVDTSSDQQRFDLLTQRDKLQAYLMGRVKGFASSVGKSSILIFADKNVRAEPLLDLMTLTKTSGFDSIQLVTQRKQ